MEFKLFGTWEDVPTLQYTSTPDTSGAAIDGFAETVAVRVMAALIAVSKETVNHYHGDFVRDAFYLRRTVYRLVKRALRKGHHFNEVFWWGADDCGTAIGQNMDDVIAARGMGKLARITLRSQLRFGVVSVRIDIDRFVETDGES